MTTLTGILEVRAKGQDHYSVCHELCYLPSAKKEDIVLRLIAVPDGREREMCCTLCGHPLIATTEEQHITPLQPSLFEE